MLTVNKSKQGIINIFDLLKYTYPNLTRICNRSHLTLESVPYEGSDDNYNRTLKVTGASDITTGEVTIPYRAFDLNECDCPVEVAEEMFSLTQVKAFMATKPIAVDELNFVREGNSYRVSATEGAYTVFGERVFALAGDGGGEEYSITVGQGQVIDPDTEQEVTGYGFTSEFGDFTPVATPNGTIVALYWTENKIFVEVANWDSQVVALNMFSQNFWINVETGGKGVIEIDSSVFNQLATEGTHVVDVQGAQMS